MTDFSTFSTFYEKFGNLIFRFKEKALHLSCCESGDINNAESESEIGKFLNIGLGGNLLCVESLTPCSKAL